jgi:hypothetical protein
MANKTVTRDRSKKGVNATGSTAPPADAYATGISATTIHDLHSFDALTKGERSIAGIYFYAVLDCLVQLAHAVSIDFFRRPHLYVNSSSVAPALAALRSRLGSHEEFPSESQRNEIYAALTNQTSTGPSAGESGDFTRLRDQLIQAATAFAERIFDTGEQMLRERVLVAYRPFKEYLGGLDGDSLRWSREISLANLTDRVSYPILRDEGVAAVFALATPPSDEWPYALDANADKIVEAIATQLSVNMDGGPPLTRERMSHLQTVALTGAEAIAAVIDFDPGGTTDELDVLITKVYTWGSELNAILA